MPRIVLASFVLVLLSYGAAVSQVIDARISGIVADSAGASIAGAKVTAVNIQTGNILVTITNNSGFYRFPIATLGEYTLTAEFRGFKKLVRSGIQLSSPQARTVDFSLELGDTAESVTVNADSEITNESRLEVGHSINARDVRDLPLVSRNPYNFIVLQPGASGRIVSGPSVIPLNSAGLLRRVGDNLDGAYINDTDKSGFRLVFVSEVYVNDIQMLSRGYPAEYGNTAGEIVNITTRSGTNQFTGEASLLMRPSGFSSRSFGSGQLPPQKNIDSFGVVASIGGPIIRDRLHYYLGFEHTVRKILPAIAIAPDSRAALVAGGLSDSIFVNTKPVVDHFPYLIVRINALLSTRSRLSFRYNRFDVSTENSGVGGTNTTELSTRVQGGDRAFGLQIVNTPSATSFNEARFAYADRNTFSMRDSRSGRAPSVIIRGNGVVAAFGPSINIGIVDTNQSTTQFTDAITKIFERHEIKVGAGINHIYDAAIDPLFSQYEFQSVADFVNARNGTDLRSYTSYSESFGEQKRPMNALFFSAYAQDDWRVTKRLKLNLGMRYDLFLPPDGVADSSYEFSRRFRTDKNNFAYRVGSSYLLKEGDHKTVFRAGTGMYYDPLQLRFYRRAILNNGNPRFFTVRFGPGDVGAPRFPESVGELPGGVAQLTPMVEAVSPNFATMYAIHSHFQLEHSITTNMSITAGYLSTVAQHIPVIGNVNCVANGETLADGRPVYGTVSVAANGNVVVDRPCAHRRLSKFGQILMAQSTGNLVYNGAFLQLVKRFAGGIQAMASYTFSKGSDDAPESVPGGQFQTDPSDRGRDKGASVGDVRHLFRASFVAEPRLNLQNPLASAFFNGFRFAGIVLADSGETFNIITNLDLNRDGVLGDRAAGIPRNSGRLPAYLGIDLRVARRFQLSRRIGLDLYCEAGNAFNKKSVSTYDPPSLGSRNIFTSTVNPLTGALKGPFPEFTTATATWRPAREIQMGLKISF